RYYAETKAVPKDKLTLGAAFFGTDASGDEYAYSDILKVDANAWSYDETKINGMPVDYTGMATMKRLAEYSKGFGGIMFWELSEDTMEQDSLYQVIPGSMVPGASSPRPARSSALDRSRMLGRPILHVTADHVRVELPGRGVVLEDEAVVALQFDARRGTV